MGGGKSIFDNITDDDLIMAFFPCIYFCEASALAMTYDHYNYRKMNYRQKTEQILKRSENRQYFYELIIKMFCIVNERKMRLIVENPYSSVHYLIAGQNFVQFPTIIDKNRRLRGDFFKKPTAYWFVNCTNTTGFTRQDDKPRKTIEEASRAKQAGLCSEERSMISPDYARNFICDFIIGKKQPNIYPTLFD